MGAARSLIKLRVILTSCLLLVFLLRAVAAGSEGSEPRTRQKGNVSW
jgi:hypothetical protein